MKNAVFSMLLHEFSAENFFQSINEKILITKKFFIYLQTLNNIEWVNIIMDFT